MPEKILNAHVPAEICRSKGASIYMPTVLIVPSTLVLGGGRVPNGIVLGRVIDGFATWPFDKDRAGFSRQPFQDIVVPTLRHITSDSPLRCLRSRICNFTPHQSAGKRERALNQLPCLTLVASEGPVVAAFVGTNRQVGSALGVQAFGSFSPSATSVFAQSRAEGFLFPAALCALGVWVVSGVRPARHIRGATLQRRGSSHEFHTSKQAPEGGILRSVELRRPALRRDLIALVLAGGAELRSKAAALLLGMLRHGRCHVSGAALGFGILAAAFEGKEDEVERVIDGDTVKLVGYGRCRLIGVNTPETVAPRQRMGEAADCYGPEASALTKNLLPEGTKVRVELDAGPIDRYGRELVYLYRAKDGLFINAELVKQGAAKHSRVTPNVRYADLFLSLETEATAAGRGLWKSCPTGKATAAAPLSKTISAVEVAQPVSGVVGDGGNPGNLKNCKDFTTYDEAKKWFDAYFPLYGDVAKLDGNGDGKPCEKLLQKSKK
ncbi:unnamed protein product [Polarella glacialis]|uniref:TNase-like domain-containing protein n=1 Tax=Polarella glacialis TaxID=89957 RepID=A0A813HV68_POLGL|nr:unnamed protein product [Polarella glacialis]